MLVAVRIDHDRYLRGGDEAGSRRPRVHGDRGCRLERLFNYSSNMCKTAKQCFEWAKAFVSSPATWNDCVDENHFLSSVPLSKNRDEPVYPIAVQVWLGYSNRLTILGTRQKDPLAGTADSSKLDGGRNIRCLTRVFESGREPYSHDVHLHSIFRFRCATRICSFHKFDSRLLKWRIEMNQRRDIAKSIIGGHYSAFGRSSPCRRVYSAMRASCWSIQPPDLKAAMFCVVKWSFSLWITCSYISSFSLCKLKNGTIG